MSCNHRARILASVLILVLCSTASAEPETMLIDGGQSNYIILHAPDAPATVRDAALELQRYLLESTGVRLPISTSPPSSTQPFISLGDAPWVRAAGMDASQLAWEGYRLRVADGRLWILGRDTADGQVTPQGGTSSGTSNGVMTFLEEQLGVRWLMPGDRGDVVPQHSRVALMAMDRVDEPGFLNRRVAYIQNKRPDVVQWSNRQKLGYSLQLNHYHNWQRTVPESLFKDHPDWFAMSNGQRTPPVGRYKLETTNPQLMAYYAKQAADAFSRNPKLYSYSLSPSDSEGWSQSPESQSLIEKDKHGRTSVTPLILKFYNDVAGLIPDTHRDRMVCGYIYASYFYPPNNGITRLNPNLMLVLAPHLSYGYTLYRPGTRDDWKDAIQTWASHTEQLSYYDLPVWWRQWIGAVTPVGPSILRFVFTNISTLKFKGVYLYGNEAWGAGAPTNYVLAKMMWNPRLDPGDLAQEFFGLAYGKTGGAAVSQLYDLLDNAFAREYQTNPESSLSPTPGMLQRIYAERFDAIEQLYLQARQAEKSDDERWRFDMLEQNLALLRWNLVKQGSLSADAAPSLARSDEQILAMLTDPANQLALGKIETSRTQQETPKLDVQRYDQQIANAKPRNPKYRLRGTTEIVFYPQGEDEMKILPTSVRDRGEAVLYQVLDAGGREVSKGVLRQSEPIVFHGSIREPLVMRINAKSAIYSLDISGAPYAIRSISENGSLHFQGQTTPVYVYIPPHVRKWTLTLSSAAPVEAAAATVIDPQGNAVASLASVNQPADRKALSNTPGGGFWCVRFDTPSSGTVDDVYLKIEEFNAFYVVDPTRPVIVSER